MNDFDKNQFSSRQPQGRHAAHAGSSGQTPSSGYSVPRISDVAQRQGGRVAERVSPSAARSVSRDAARPASRDTVRETARPASYGAARPRGSHAASPAAESRVDASQYTRARYGQNTRSYRQSRRRNTVLSVIMGISMVILVGSVAALGYIWFQYHHGTAVYDDIADHAVTEDVFVPETPDEELDLSSLTVDWDYLRSLNEDVVGWIYMPNTEINYPIVQGDSDDEYLWKDFTGQPGSVVNKGTLFLSTMNTRSMSDQISFIYGHNMHDGSMFSIVHETTKQETFDSVRTFYVLTPTMNYRCRTFAVDQVPETQLELIKPNFGSEQDFLNYLNERVAGSSVKPVDDVATEDISKVFALVSCAVHGDGTRVLLYGSAVESAAPQNAGEESAENPESVNSVGEGLAETEAELDGSEAEAEAESDAEANAESEDGEADAADEEDGGEQ